MPSQSGIKAGRAYIVIDAVNKTDAVLQSVSRRFKRTGQKLMSMGQGMMQKSLAALLPAGLMTKHFADFEHQMALVSTMLQEPQKYMDGFRAGIRDLSKKFGKDTGDLGKGLYDILSAQVAPDKALDMLRASSELAVSGNADVAASTSAMITLMETYGDSLRDAGDGADFLMSVVARGRTTLPELADSIGMVVSLGKEAGLSLEDTGASLALMTRAIGDTQRSVIALQAVAATFLKPSAEGAEAWEQKFGDVMNSATLKALGMQGVLERMKTLTADEVATIFPNVRAIRGIMPAIAKMEGFGDDIATVTNRAGTMNEAFEKMKNSPLFKLQKAWQSIKDTFVTVGAALWGPIEKLLSPVQDLLERLSTWVSKNEELVANLLVVAATVGVLGAGLATLGILVSTIGTAIGFLGSAFTALGAVIGGLGAIMASPFALLGILIAGAVGLLLGFSKSFRKIFTNMFGWIGKQLSKWAGKVVDFFKAIMEGRVAFGFWSLPSEQKKKSEDATASLEATMRNLEKSIEDSDKENKKLVDEEKDAINQLVEEMKNPPKPQEDPRKVISPSEQMGINRPIQAMALKPLEGLRRGSVEAARQAYENRQRHLEGKDEVPEKQLAEAKKGNRHLEDIKNNLAVV